MIDPRGPSNQTCLIAWDRSDDYFKVGQWFTGTVKPARSGLAPKGAWLVQGARPARGSKGPADRCRLSVCGWAGAVR